MTDRLSLSERVNTLFAVWTTPGEGPQTSTHVAAAVTDRGTELAVDALDGIRAGNITEVDERILVEIAKHFRTPPEYLTDDDPQDLHSQLLLLQELSGAGVRTVRLRSVPDPSDREALLRVLEQRER